MNQKPLKGTQADYEFKRSIFKRLYPNIAGENGDTEHETYRQQGNKPMALLKAGINYDHYLLAEGFIERGTAGLFAGKSGIGKSSIAMQKAILWSIGLSAFDLAPRKPLRIMMTQTEDSGNDIVKQLAVINALGLTQVQQELLDYNLWIETLRGYTGKNAVSAWTDLCKWHKADLLIVNPLSAYHDGDISSNEDNQDFLYGKVGKMISDLQIGMWSAHHKTKPNAEKKGLAYGDKMYNMLGGSVLTNFHRAIILVEEIGESEVYEFTIAKRFSESHWTTHTQMFKWDEDQSKRLWIPASVAEAENARATTVSRADLYKLVPINGLIHKCVLESNALNLSPKKFTQKSFRAILEECLSDLTPDNERLYEVRKKNPVGGPKTYITRSNPWSADEDSDQDCPR